MDFLPRKSQWDSSVVVRDSEVGSIALLARRLHLASVEQSTQGWPPAEDRCNPPKYLAASSFGGKHP